MAYWLTSAKEFELYLYPWLTVAFEVGSKAWCGLLRIPLNFTTVSVGQMADIVLIKKFSRKHVVLTWEKSKSA